MFCFWSLLLLLCCCPGSALLFFSWVLLFLGGMVVREVVESFVTGRVLGGVIFNFCDYGGFTG